MWRTSVSKTFNCKLLLYNFSDKSTFKNRRQENFRLTPHQNSHLRITNGKRKECPPKNFHQENFHLKTFHRESLHLMNSFFKYAYTVVSSEEVTFRAIGSKISGSRQPVTWWRPPDQRECCQGEPWRIGLRREGDTWAQPAQPAGPVIPRGLDSATAEPHSVETFYGSPLEHHLDTRTLHQKLWFGAWGRVLFLPQARGHHSQPWKTQSENLKRAQDTVLVFKKLYCHT